MTAIDFRRLSMILIPFLAIDALFFAAHILAEWRVARGIPVSDMWFVTKDGSFGEIYNYVKYAIIALYMVMAYKMGRTPFYIAYGLAFIVILADDALQLHERGGAALVWLFDLGDVSGLRPAIFTSVIIQAALSLAILVILVVGYRASGTRGRQIAWVLLAPLFGLAVSATLVDFVGAAFEVMPHGRARWLLIAGMGLVEDGGEMIFASISAALAILLARSQSRLRAVERPSDPNEPGLSRRA